MSVASSRNHPFDFDKGLALGSSYDEWSVEISQ